MQTVIEVSEQTLKLLDALSQADGVPSAELAGRAVESYVSQRTGAERSVSESTPEPVLSWANMDGVEYQQRIRAEWDREWD